MIKLSILITLLLIEFNVQFKTTNLYLSNNNSSDCKVQVQENNIVLLCHDKKTTYQGLLINEMSISTNFSQGTNNEFSLIYELNASATKVKEIYFINPGNNEMPLKKIQ